MIWFGVPYFAYILGGLVGGGELVSRYPDAPRAALRTAPGIFYVIVNAFAAMAALVVGAVLAEEQLVTPQGVLAAFATVDLLNLVLISGFGSLAFFRAKIITLRVGDSDVGVGPSFVLEIILKAADRAVDRKRAELRARFVSDIMSPVSFEEAKIVLPTYCFAVMQNVTVEEQQRVALEIEALSSADMPDRVKALNLGLLLLNIVGAEVLEVAVKNLQEEFAAASRVLESVEDAMAAIDFDKAALNLTPLCAELAEMDDEDREQLEFEVQRLRSVSLTDQTRRYLYGLLLIRSFGSEIVSRAITAISEDIANPHAPVPPPAADDPLRDTETPV